MSAAKSLAPELLALSSLVEEHPQYLASGSKELQKTALAATTFVFDLALKSESRSVPLITDLLQQLSPDAAPETRAQAARANGKKRKLAPSLRLEHTPLTSLFTDGMDEDQIWAQLELRTTNICKMLQVALEGGDEDAEEQDVDEEDKSEDDGEDAEEKALRKAMAALENGEDFDMEGLEFGGEDSDEDAFLDEDSEEEGENGAAEEEEEEDDNIDLGEGVAQLRDAHLHKEEDEEEEEDELEGHPMRKLSRSVSKKKQGRRSELDDGFFSLAAFNAETEAAEARTVSKGGLGSDDDSDDMSVDLFAPVDGDEDDDMDGDNVSNLTGEPLYKDFFEPPPRSFVKPPPKSSKGKGKAAPSLSSPSKPANSSKVRFNDEVRVKNIKAKGKNLPLSGLVRSASTEEDDDGGEDAFGEMDVDDEDDEEEDEDEMDAFGNLGAEGEEDEDDGDSGSDEEGDEGLLSRETIARLKDDLFADEEEVEQGNLTTHQKRMAALKDQIAELETQNVGPKDWTLMGEANTRARPQNSLLEEDLEFERVMKAVPVVTEESVAVLEERIKARILEGRFDDVVRLRAVEDKPFLPSRFFELKDTKSAQSLSQIYENEYTAAQTGGVVGEDKDGKLKKEHDDIEKLWDGICGKLDALCNAHFMPKQPKATISTITNMSTTSLESALPTTKSASTMLAPEEVFSTTSSDTRARSELTPGEKRTLRGKERKLKKKTRDALDLSVDKYAKMRGIGGVKKRKQAALESVVKHGKGVTVVGKSKKDILAKKGRRPQAT